MSPVVTLLVASYGRPDYLRGLLNTVAPLLSDKVELVVSDDLSPESPRIRQELASREGPRFRVLAQSSRLGMVGNWLALLEAAHGEYVYYVGDDDEIDADAFHAAFEELIARRPEALLTGYRVIDEKGTPVASNSLCRSRDLGRSPLPFSLLWTDFSLFLRVAHSFSFFVRAEWLRANPFDASVGIGADRHLLYRLILSGSQVRVSRHRVLRWRVPSARSADYRSLSSDRLRTVESNLRVYHAILLNYNHGSRERRGFVAATLPRACGCDFARLRACLKHSPAAEADLARLASESDRRLMSFPFRARRALRLARLRLLDRLLPA